MFRITNSLTATARLCLSGNSNSPIQIQRIGAEMTKRWIGAQVGSRFSPSAVTLSTRVLVSERSDQMGFQKPSMLFYSTMGIPSHSIRRRYTKPMLPNINIRSFYSPYIKYLNPQNDLVFKKVFGQEKHKQIPIDFLNATLRLTGKDKIVNLGFLNPYQPPEIAARKESLIDTLVQDQRGVQYIVQIKVAQFKGFEKRAQFYAAKTYCSHFGKGEQYQNIKKVIFLAITNYEVFPRNKGYRSDHVILENKSYENDLQGFSFTFIELPKFQKPIDHLENKEDKWIFFLKHADESIDVEKLIANHPEIREAYKVLDIHHWSKAELQYYDQLIMSEADMRGALDAAREEGFKKEQTQVIASKMLKRGRPIEEIIKYTGLTAEKMDLPVGPAPSQLPVPGEPGWDFVIKNVEDFQRQHPITLDRIEITNLFNQMKQVLENQKEMLAMLKEMSKKVDALIHNLEGKEKTDDQHTS